MKLIWDTRSGLLVGTGTGENQLPAGLEYLDAPDGFDLERLSDYTVVDGVPVLDAALVLARLKARRIDEIRQQAAANIAALQWRIERAQERDRLGLPGETVEAVLLEREAIRRASNRCQAEIEAAQDAAAVQAVVFAVTDADGATPQRLTRLRFLSRFTDAEMQAIVAAAETSPALKAALLKWQTAEGIVLTDPATIAGVQALEMIGLIGAGRAAQILTAAEATP